MRLCRRRTALNATEDGKIAVGQLARAQANSDHQLGKAKMASSKLPSVRYASTLLITAALAVPSFALAADTSRRTAEPGDLQKSATTTPEEYFPTDNQIPLGRDGKPLSPDMVALGEKVR